MSKRSPHPPRRRPLDHDADTTKVSEIRDIRVMNVELQTTKPPKKSKKRKASVIGDQDDNDGGWYKVFYAVNIQTPNGTKRIVVASIKDMGEDPSSVMMERTRDAIRKRQDEFNIDYQLGSGPMYMDKDDFWEYLWVYAENEINNIKLAKEAKSAESRRGHQTRVDAINEKDWEKGEEYKNAVEKHRAKASVMSAIEKATNKETKKAEAVLKSVINDLTKEGLNEERVQTDHTFQLLATASDMFESVQGLIKQMSKNMTLKSARLLTGLVAMMVPQNRRVSIRDYSHFLGVNRDAKYFCEALDNRIAYDEYLELDGPIQVGEKVICRGGEGVLVEMDGDSPTIELHPYKTQKKYNSINAAQMRRHPPQLDYYNRDERCDKTPRHVIAIIDTFFRRHVPMSPNKNDVVKKRHPTHRTQVEVKQPLVRYEPMNNLWATFKIEHPELALQIQNNNRPHQCPKLLRDHAPWEMIKAKDVSCLCINCEGMNALLRGVCAATDAINRVVDRVGANTDVEEYIGLLLTIKELINLPSKYEMCVQCLSPCLKTGKLEDAEQKCLDGTCTACGFERLWGRKVRRNLFSITVGQQPVLNIDSPLVGDGDEWSAATIDWRRYVYEQVPTAATHAQDVARQAAAARAANRDDVDANDDEYNPNENATSRRLCLATTRGTLVDFLDTVQSMLKKHINHRNLVAVERRAQLYWERNFRPFMISRNMDYSENGNMKDNIQVQSQHWGNNQFTLFVSIVCWLLVEEWDKEEGELEEQNEVTVNGEKSGEPFNVNAFYARVTKVLGNDMYEVTDVNDNKSNHHRRHLRLRKRHSIAIGHVSDDKIHDRHSMQHFTSQELAFLEKYMNDNFPNDLPHGHITILFTHSDNAAQHFKSTGAMQYYASLTKERGGAGACAYVYCFGAPGHGKGPYDGIGGRWKGMIDSCIRSSTTEGLLKYTGSGYIETVNDVYDALVHKFENADHRDVQLAGRNPIHKYKFFLNTVENNPIERPADESFITLDGISKHYQITVASEDNVYMRRQSCWCPPCMKTLMQPSSGWSAQHNITGCQSLCKSHGANNSAYEFTKHCCKKTTGRNVAEAIRHRREELNQQSAALTVGEWVIYHGIGANGEEDPDQPLWLGRVMPNSDWNGQGVLENTTGSTISYPMGIEVKRNEVAIYVQWYEKIDLNSDELKYHVSRDITEPQVQNNQLLLHSRLKLTPLHGDSNPVPRSRPGSRQRQQSQAAEATTTLGDYARPRQNNQSSYASWHNVEYGIVWEMAEEDRDFALGERQF